MDEIDDSNDLPGIPEEVKDLIKKIESEFLSSMGPMMEPMTEREKLEARISIAKQVSKEMGVDIPPDNIEIIQGMKFEF